MIMFLSNGGIELVLATGIFAGMVIREKLKDRMTRVTRLTLKN